MKAAAQPRFVYGSTTAVTMCSARNTSVIRARLRCSPVVRKRGQRSLWTRSVERMPRTTTVLSRISVTDPAPRVLYQRRLFGTADQCEPPVTTVAVPEDELTPLEDWSPLESPAEVEDVDDVDDVVVDEEEGPDVPAVDAVGLEDPGIVAALTALNTPTPAMAARAAPVVRRFSVRIAASRARILVSVSFLVLSILGKLGGRR